jgi:hypothetical protein
MSCIFEIYETRIKEKLQSGKRAANVRRKSAHLWQVEGQSLNVGRPNIAFIKSGGKHYRIDRAAKLVDMLLQQRIQR